MYLPNTSYALRFVFMPALYKSFLLKYLYVRTFLNDTMIGTVSSGLLLTLVLKQVITRMWANAQRDGRPAEHRWRPLFNAAKFG